MQLSKELQREVVPKNILMVGPTVCCSTATKCTPMLAWLLFLLFMWFMMGAAFTHMQGVGKTEVARRLANLLNAPFVKVEATKFTEVGFHGRDVDMIIR